MFNNLIYSTNLMPIFIKRTGVMPDSVISAPIIRPVDIGMVIGGAGNDTITIGGGGGPPGPVGPPGPPGPAGPPGTPGLVPVTIVTTTPYSATLADYLIDVNVAGPSSVILPVSPIGTVFMIKDLSGNSLTNPITVTAAGPTLIDGTLSATIDTNFGAGQLIFNGTQWNIV